MADLHKLDNELLEIRDAIEVEIGRLEACRPPGRAESVRRRLKALADRVDSVANEIMGMQRAAEDAKRESIFS